MKQEEKHHVGNTAQMLRLACRRLATASTKLKEPTQEVNDAIQYIELSASRLERVMKGRVCDKQTAVFNRYSDLELLTMLLIGEAEGEPWESKVGVGLTVRNRVEVRKRCFGVGWRGVMLAPNQFTCFSSKPRVKAMIRRWRTKDTIWQEHFGIATNIYLDLFEDFVGRPLYYHATSFKPHGWWLKLHRLGRFGNHVFYTDPSAIKDLT